MMIDNVNYSYNVEGDNIQFDVKKDGVLTTVTIPKEFFAKIDKRLRLDIDYKELEEENKGLRDELYDIKQKHKENVCVLDEYKETYIEIINQLIKKISKLKEEISFLSRRYYDNDY